MAEFQRPSGERFAFKGVKTNDVPDAFPPDKFSYAQNVRGYNDREITSRPQLTQIIAEPVISPGPVLSLEPTIGVYKIAGAILSNGTAIAGGFSTTLGASILPFRPNASPDPWDYIFDDLKSAKVNLSGGAPIVKGVGMPESQAPAEASTGNQFQSFMDSVGATWAPGGTTTAIPGDSSRTADVVGAVFVDPASQGDYTSFQVSPNTLYSKGMVVNIHGELYIVNDVFPNMGTPIGILGVKYYVGNTGKCVILPANLANEEPSLYTQLLLTSIRRGAIVQIGAEKCFVLSSSVGPDGSVSFETSTVGTHAAGETMIVLAAVAVVGSGIVTGQAINSNAIAFFCLPGLGTVQKPLGANPFVNGQFSFQPDDYIHFSLKTDFLANLTEMKILFDVGDGSFTQNFFFYSVRPSDIAAGVQNVQTQLGVAQIVDQRRIIDEERAITAYNQHRTASSAQTEPGDHQWSEIFIPIKELTRVGEDQSATLQNANAIQFLFNVNNAPNTNPGDGLTLHINSITVVGGFQPDVGYTGMPYQYFAIPRDSTTGAQGNPSPVMRYGVSPRRQLVFVPLPAYNGSLDPDTWDIYRVGGSIEVPRYLGSTPLGTAVFEDNYSDIAIAEAREMPRDKYEPFPSIGPPISTNNSNIVGTLMVATFPTGTPNKTLLQLQNLLPGNVLNIGQQVFTLWNRPVLLSTGVGTQTWLFQFVENAGALTNPLVQINEPTLAAQSNQAVWGPDSNGVFFAVQDPLRPGFVNRTNPNDPDSCSDASDDDLCPPSEPLQNGALLNQTSIVFSPARAWAGYPKAGGGYRWVEIPTGAGLAAEFGICTDGKNVYFVAKDGIRRTSGGPSESLTDADLYNIFPHEGIFATPVVTPAGTIFPPDYTQNQAMRLAVVNGYLFFDYIANGIYRTLVCDLRTGAWNLDIGVNPLTVHAGSTADGSLQDLFVGDFTGAIFQEESNPTPSTGEDVVCALVTREMMRDLRASTMFGDMAVDLTPASDVVVTPITLGVALPPTTITAGARQVSVIDLEGQQIKRSLGLKILWSDQGVNSRFFSWQPSEVPQPEDTTDRFGDWDDLGTKKAKFIQGIRIEADTFGQDKVLNFRNADDGTIAASLTINHAGQQEKAYSFLAPFVSHLVREEPDETPWRKFSFDWVWEPTPENVLNWETQGSSFGMNGYVHIFKILAAYASTDPVNLNITCFDGVSPQQVVLPPTGGAYQKVLFTLTANKGLLYFFQGVSTSPWKAYLDDWEISVKEWGSAQGYSTYKNLGGERGDQARI